MQRVHHRMLDDEHLIQRWRERRDQAALDELVRRHEPLARWVAARYAATTTEPFDDLVQVARAGLVAALQRFDPERSARVAAFVTPVMIGEVRRYFRDSSWALHVPRSTKVRVRELRRTVAELSSSLGRSPTIREIAARLEVSREAVLETLEARDCYRTQPFDAHAADDVEGAAQVGVEEDGYRGVDNRLLVERALRALDERERQIVAMRFEQELTQVEIARRLGCSQMQVSRLLRRALERMRSLTAYPDAA